MNQGEIWQVNFSPSVGDEITKTRPALIVSSNAVGKLRLKIVAPITDPSFSQQSWHVHINKSSTNGLTKASIVDCFQIKSISTDRFIKKLGVLNENDLDDVKIGLTKVLDLF